MRDLVKRRVEGNARETLEKLKWHLGRVIRFNGRLPQQLPLTPEQLATLFAAQSVCEVILAEKSA